MKTKKLLYLSIVTLALATLIGCATKNAAYNPAAPISESNPVYLPATNQIAHIVDTAQTGIAVVTPFIPPPYNAAAPLISQGVALAGLIGTGLATLIAGYQNSQAKKHKNAAAALASVVTANPSLATAALTAANSNGSAGTVAEHLASAASPT